MLIKFCEVVDNGLLLGDAFLFLRYFLPKMQLVSVQAGDLASKYLLCIFDFVLGFFQLIFDVCGLALRVFDELALAANGVLVLVEQRFAHFVLPLDVVQLLKYFGYFRLLLI